MRASQNERTGTWHLLGARGCGAEPAGETVEGTWAVCCGTTLDRRKNGCPACGSWDVARYEL